MAIVNKLTTLFPAFGAPTEYVTLLAQNLPAAATTPFVLTGFVNFVRSGRIRVKSTAAGTGAVTGIVITATDGTTTVAIYGGGGAVAASTLFDLLFHFISELNLTSITVSITVGAGTASTIDLEIAGNP